MAIEKESEAAGYASTYDEMQECIANGTLFKNPGTEEYVDSLYGEGRRSNFFPWGCSSADESPVASVSKEA